MSPRPILKDLGACEPNPFPFASCSNILPSPHVHFPPTPTLTETYTAYSPSTYDRAPIDVSENSCALPARGERTYVPEAPTSSRATKGSYFHPLAYKACEREPPHHARTPLLVTDVSSSSDSDDPDNLALTPPEPHSAPPIYIHFGNDNAAFVLDTPGRSRQEIDIAMSFLPHPHSPVREKGRRMPSPTKPRLMRRGRSFTTTAGFETPTLDGCLGGF